MMLQSEQIMIGGEEPSLWPATFKEAFCAKYRIRKEDFERKVFWRIMNRHALLFALLIYKWRPNFFREDFYLIREAGEMRNPQLFTQELNYFHGRNARDKNWFRAGLGIRVSGKRLIRLKNKVVAPI